MNQALFSLSIFAVFCCAGLSAGDYLLSSEQLIRENRASLEDYTTFVFVPILHTKEKNRAKISVMMSQELQRVGIVERPQVFTEQGMDFTLLSNPCLQFGVEQLVDKKGKLLPVIKATLSISSAVEVLENHEITSLATNSWSMYCKHNDDVAKIVKQTLPSLLNQFIDAFQVSNGKEVRPTFYIIDTTEKGYTQTTSKVGQWTGLKAAENQRPQAS